MSLQIVLLLAETNLLFLFYEIIDFSMWKKRATWRVIECSSRIAVSSCLRSSSSSSRYCGESGYLSSIIGLGQVVFVDSRGGGRGGGIK